MAQQVLLAHTEGLVGVTDLGQAYSAVKSGRDVAPGMTVRFKKKEDIGALTKSILKHKIQTLTGKSVKVIEEEMQYKPKDPNEPSMDIDTMRQLAISLILLSNGALPNQTNGASAEKGKKRANEDEELASAPQSKAARRSLGSTARVEEVEESKVVQEVKKKGRRSLAVVPTPASPAGRISKRKSLSGSMSVSSCPSPSPAIKEHLALVEEKEEKEDQASIDNPTPMMLEMMNKRKSVGTKTPLKSRADTILAKSKEKSKEKQKPAPASPPLCPPSPGPRQDFPGKNGAKAFLVAGQPMELRLAKLTKSLPLSSGFNGCHLAVVHTPADWGPQDIFSIADKVKKLNKEAGLNSFVLLVGTGLQNVHMSIEALQRHTKHTQFLTFHRSDANLGEETGKLRETCSYFLVAYFFPGSEVDGSVVPAKMVRDGFTTCFVTESTLHLESSIIDCFSEEGEWLLDIACGSRQLSVAALERGRSSVALHAEVDALEDLGNYLRTVSLEVDPTYREKDGIVGLLSA